MGLNRSEPDLLDRANRPWFFMILPTFVMLFLISIYPTIYTLFNSLFSWNYLRPLRKSFVGLGNFVQLFQDSLFRDAVCNTLVLVFFAVVSEFLIGLIAALLIDTDLRGFRIIRGLLLIPTMITPVVAALMWLLMYNTDFGILRYLLEAVNIRAPIWLADPKWALFSVLLVDVWQWTPFVILLLLAGLKSIPDEIFEAATVDGANNVQMLFFVIFPCLRQIMLVVLLIRTMDALKFFDPIYVLTKGGPGSCTETVSFFVYRQGFRFFEVGYGSAAAILVLVLISLISRGLIRTLGQVSSEIN